MAKPEWGTKRMCQSCGAKFYDFERSPILCPSCGANFDPETLLRARRGKATPAKAKVTKPQEIEDTNDEEEDLAAVEEDDSLIESDDDLGDDEDVGTVAVDDESEKEN